MRRFFVILAIATVVLLGGTGAGLYWYLRKMLPRLPEIAREAAKAQGVEVAWSEIAVASSGLGITLLKPRASSETWSLDGENLSASLELAPRIPPVRALLQLNGAVIREQLGDAAEPTARSESATPIPSWIGIPASLLEFEVHIRNASVELVSTKLAEIDATFEAKKLGIKEGRLDRLAIRHSLSIKRWKERPYLTPVKWSGTSHLRSASTITVEAHRLGAGLLSLNLSGKGDLTSGKWSAELSVPNPQLSATSEALGPAAAEWVERASGELHFSGTVQGLGLDPRTIRAEATLAAKKVTMRLKHPFVKGDVAADLAAEISHGSKLAIQGKGQVDLTDAWLTDETQFVKPKGVVLTLACAAESSGETTRFPECAGKFHTMTFRGQGSIGQGDDPNADATLTISRSSLVGWESFFPRLSQLRTEGTLEASLSYRGPIRDWRSASIVIDAKAQRVRFPLLPSFFPNEQLTGSGVLSLDSVTRIHHEKGALRELSTRTDLDLGSVEIAGEGFQKPSGVPFRLSAVVTSNSKRAQVTKGELELAGLRGKVVGSIERFESPIANLSWSTTAWELATVTRFLKKPLVSPTGTIVSKGTIRGPLLAKRGDSPLAVQGTATVSRLALDYEMEKGGRKLGVRGGGVQVAFAPGPNLRIGFNAQEVFFRGGDASGAPAGLIAVPAGTSAGDASQAAPDFRENPLLKSAKLSATVGIQKLDLGSTKAERVTAKIDYDKLLLRITPLKMQMLGGEITSTTEWNGREKVPTTKQKLVATGVDANDFVSSYSPSSKDLLFGKLSMEMAAQFSGMTAEAMKTSARGEGKFALADAEIRTLPLTRKPLESLKSVPVLGKMITKTEWQEKISSTKGTFKLTDGKLVLNDVLARSPYFEATLSDATYRFDGTIASKLAWKPTPKLVGGETLEFLKDESGQPSVPLVIGGTLKSPSVELDTSVVTARVQAYAARRLAAEKDRAVKAAKDAAKSRIEEEVKKRMQGLPKFFE